MTATKIHYTDENASVDASPMKSFFVSMLTRDIQLEDAILDLLDNCVDGILRSNQAKAVKPYEGYKADIEFNGDRFSISDNCGGIPWSLYEYTFRMGPPSEPYERPAGSVGVYGIGMKRALFKLGQRCRVSTRHGSDQYEAEISPGWMKDETRWRIPVRPSRTNMDHEGTRICVTGLNPGIEETFSDGVKLFTTNLIRMIATHYAYIIEKGFQVTVNGRPVMPRTTTIVFAGKDVDRRHAIEPFVFEAEVDGVRVNLVVGFTRPIPAVNEISDEQEGVQYSSIDAGWTILCNDRAVVYCDRSELTGWGEAGVPRYHTQFIAISGIVEFSSDDPKKLPTTTTKRGIDASSPLYLQVKNKMREGLRVFTTYTNQWKGLAEDSKQQIQMGSAQNFMELKANTKNLSFTATRTPPPGRQYKPSLPRPPRVEPTKRRIAFIKEIDKIQVVANYLGDSDMHPAEVGESCFENIYVEASR